MGITDDDPLYVSLAVHQDPDLAIDLSRDLRQAASKLVGDQISRRDTSLVELLEAPALQRLETESVARELVYCLCTSVLSNGIICLASRLYHRRIARAS